MTTTISGADALIRSLIDADAGVVFGYPGGAIMPVYDALYRIETDDSATNLGAEGFSQSVLIDPDPLDGDIFVSDMIRGNVHRWPYGSATNSLWVSGFDGGGGVAGRGPRFRSADCHGIAQCL